MPFGVPKRIRSPDNSQLKVSDVQCPRHTHYTRPSSPAEPTVGGHSALLLLVARLSYAEVCHLNSQKHRVLFFSQAQSRSSSRLILQISVIHVWSPFLLHIKALRTAPDIYCPPASISSLPLMCALPPCSLPHTSRQCLHVHFELRRVHTLTALLHIKLRRTAPPVHCYPCHKHYLHLLLHA